MRKWVIYNKKTGEIVCRGITSSDDFSRPCGEDEELMFGEGLCEHHYVDVKTKKIKERQELNFSIDKYEISAGGVDAATISGLDANAKVLVNGRQAEIERGSVRLTSEIRQIMRVMIQQPKCYPVNFMITAQ